MTPRTTRLLKWIGYPAYAFFAFFICIYWAFPAERAKQIAEDLLSTGGRVVTIGDLSISPLASVNLENVVVRFPPEPPKKRGPGAEGAPEEKKKPLRLVLDNVSLSVGLFSMMGGGVDAGFDIEAMGGRIKGEYQQERKKGFSASVELEGVSAQRVPWLQAAGPPFKGRIGGKLSVESPSMKRFNKLSGEVEIECSGCSFGDDKGKIKVAGNPMMAQGLTVPRIPLGRLNVRLKAAKGVVEIEQLSAQSKDVELQAEGKVTLRAPLDFSVIETYVRIKISEALKKKNDKFSVIDLAFSDGKRTDGFIGVLIRGAARKPKVKGSKLGLGKRARRGGALRNTPRTRAKPRRGR